MTLRTPDPAAVKRGELDRARDRRELLPAMEARRNLNAREADDVRARTRATGPADPRYAYLTDSHD
jgi:hypothetical protein